MNVVLDALHKALPHLDDFFEQIRRDIGRKGFVSQNEGIHWSKVGIKAVKRNDHAMVKEADKAMLESLNVLLYDASLPADLRWEFQNSLSAEYIEFLGFRILHPYIFSAMPITKGTVSDQILEQFSADKIRKLGITEQACLAGLADVPGELSRALTEFRISHSLDLGGHIAMLRLYIDIVKPIVDFLDNFEVVYEMAIASSRRRGWFNTFRAKLGRAGGALLRREEQLEELLARKAV